jgi:hypothetical protein
MVIYSARKQGIDEDTIASIYQAEKAATIKDKVVANDQDLFNFKNRIIIIVRSYHLIVVDREISGAVRGAGHRP